MPTGNLTMGNYIATPTATTTATQTAAAQNAGWKPTTTATPTTGTTYAGGAVLPPVYNPPSGGTAMASPVVTAQSAQNDYNQKYQALQDLMAQQRAQGVAQLNQQSIAAQDKAMKDVNDAQNNLKQQGIDIQRQQAQTQQTEAKAKADAIALANGQAPQPQTDTATPPQNAPTGTTAPQGATPTTGADANNAITSATNSFTDAQQQIQAQKDQVYSQMNSALTSVLQGTVPLSAPQQALISSLQTQLQQNVQVQQQVNASYTGAVSEAAFRSGGEYTPAEMAGAIANSVTVGVDKIQMLDNAAATTIANLEQEFQKQNFEEINQQYGNLLKQLDDKSGAIKDMYTAVTGAIRDQRDFQQKQNQQNIENQLNNAKYGLDADKFAFEKAKVPTQVVDYGDGSALINSETGKVIKTYPGKLSADAKNAEQAKAQAQATVPLLQDKVNQIQRLLDSKAYEKVVGTSEMGRHPIISKFTGEAQGAIADIKQLTSKEVLDTLVGLKAQGGTLGALSDSEGALLRSAATKIGSWEKNDSETGLTTYDASEQDFRIELETIQNLAKRAINKAKGISADNPMGLDLGTPGVDVPKEQDSLNLGI